MALVGLNDSIIISDSQNPWTFHGCTKIAKVLLVSITLLAFYHK